MAGLIIVDQMGGDYAVFLVDEERWSQIQELTNLIKNRTDFLKVVSWICSDAPESEEWRPSKIEECPMIRKGKIISTWNCQSPVTEKVCIEIPIYGIIFI